MPDDVITDVAVIARELGISRKEVYRLAKTGQGPVIQIGGKGGRIHSRAAWIARYREGIPGFWSAAPQEPSSEYRNPFLRRVP